MYKPMDVLVAEAGDLPAMFTIAMQIMKLCGDPTTNAGDLTAIISRDQAISARVLKFANSALYSFSRKILSINEAIVILGFKTLKTLVVAASSHSMYRKVKKTGIEENILWKHSIATAICSKKIAKRVRYVEGDTAFTAALLHDIGKVIINNYDSPAFLAVIEDVYNNGVSSLSVEEEFLGYNHAQLGSAVLNKWKFPEELYDVVGNHHQPQKSQLDQKLCSIVNLSDKICIADNYGIGEVEENLHTSPSAIFLGINELAMLQIRQELGDDMKSEASLFSS